MCGSPESRPHSSNHRSPLICQHPSPGRSVAASAPEEEPFLALRPRICPAHFPSRPPHGPSAGSLFVNPRSRRHRGGTRSAALQDDSDARCASQSGNRGVTSLSLPLHIYVDPRGGERGRGYKSRPSISPSERDRHCTVCPLHCPLSTVHNEAVHTHVFHVREHPPRTPLQAPLIPFSLRRCGCPIFRSWTTAHTPPNVEHTGSAACQEPRP